MAMLIGVRPVLSQRAVKLYPYVAVASSTIPPCRPCCLPLSLRLLKSANLVASRGISDLGLRSQRPPDSTSNLKDPPPSSEISDKEWEIRTGRAIYVIRETLPEFFETGLVTSVNKATGMPSRSPPPTNINFLEPTPLKDDEEPIYCPNISLSYTPPSQLPAPFPKTFRIEGLQVYLASSAIIRHAMKALYHNLTLTTNKLVISSPPSIPSALSGGARKVNRDKSFLVRQTVTGVSRVSGKPNEWEIESTFTFSPTTGLIQQHVVNSLHPAPHLAVYDSLRLSLGKLLGWEPGSGATTNGAACKGNSKN